MNEEILKKVANELGPNVVFEGLLRKSGRLKNTLASSATDVLGRLFCIFLRLSRQVMIGADSDEFLNK